MKKKIFFASLLGVFVLVLSGCSSEIPSAPSTDSYTLDTKKVEETQKKIQGAVPIPDIKTSAERQNIARRAKLFDDENKISYIYLVNYGKVMAFYTVKGKVSSLNSYMTPEDKLVYADGSTCNRNESTGDISASSSWEPCYTVSAPDIDGAYGVNADGIFFFTTEGAYVEWQGDYMVSDQPLRISTPVELIREVK